MDNFTCRKIYLLSHREKWQLSWDGSYEGSPVPEGQYYYEINATDFKGELTKSNGRIVVVR